MEEDRVSRYHGTGLLRSLGMILKLPQTTIATSQVFLHRFYLRHSLQKYHVEQLAPALIFLAAKVEEHPRKLVDIYAATAQNATPFEEWKDQIIRLERIILKTLCFDLTVEHPYRIALQLVKQLPEVADDDLIQDVWFAINEMFRTPLPILSRSGELAAAAIWWTLQKEGRDVASKSAAPSNDDEEEFAAVSVHRLSEICCHLRNLADKPIPP